MKRLQGVIIAFFLFFAQTPWIQNMAAAVTFQEAGGGYIMADMTDSSVQGSTDVWVTKTDPDPTQYAYVTDIANDTVSAIRISDPEIIGLPLTVGSKPRGVAIAPDGLTVYVANRESGTITVINTATNAGFDVTVGGAPVGIAVSPDGSFVYVTNVSLEVLSVINTDDDYAISLKIQVGESPFGVAVLTEDDMDIVFVANRGDNTVSVVEIDRKNLEDDPRIRFINVGAKPIGIAVSPYGDAVYVANRQDGTLSRIDVDSIDSYIELQESDDPNTSYVPTIPVQDSPYGVAVSVDGDPEIEVDRVFVANRGNDTVSVFEIDRGDNTLSDVKVFDPIKVDKKPYGIAASFDGTFVVVTSYEIGEEVSSGTVTIMTKDNDTYSRTSLTINEDGNSAPASFGQFVGSVPGPEPAHNFVAQVVSINDIKLTWDHDGFRVTEFVIERSIDESSPWDTLTTIDAETDSFAYTDTGRTEGTTYYYRIEARNAVSNSEYSMTQAKTFPSPPTDLTATAVSTSQIDLSWTHDANEVAEFIIFRKPGPNKTNEYEEIDRVDENVRSYSDTVGLNDFTSYTYKMHAAREIAEDLTAFDDNVVIAYSNEDSATTFLAAPTNLSILDSTRNYIELRWNDNSSAEAGYRIERKKLSDDVQSSSDEESNSDTGNFTQIAEVGKDTTGFKDEDLDPNTEYAYRVLAYSGSEVSDYSNEAQADTSQGLCFIGAAAGHSDFHVDHTFLTFSKLLLFIVSVAFGFFYRKSTSPVSR